MKKTLIAAIAVLVCTAVEAGEPENIQALSAKVILQNTHGYFALADGNCFKAIGFSKRWRTLSEWWNNVQIVPQSYECVPNDWFVGTQIEVYPKNGNLMVNEGDASNQESLRQCTHLLVNTRTGQILFAISMHPAECISQLYKDAFSDGHTEGYDKGRQSSSRSANEIYNEGHAAGYRVGYTAGYRAAVQAEEQPGSR